MQEHQQQQQQMQEQAAQAAGQQHQADIQSKQAKAAADMALAKERQINAVKGVHDMRSDFTAPPYGQSHVAEPPDAPSAPGTVGPAPMVPHASGGLVTRTQSMPDPVTTLAPKPDPHYIGGGADEPIFSWHHYLPNYRRY